MQDPTGHKLDPIRISYQDAGMFEDTRRGDIKGEFWAGSADQM